MELATIQTPALLPNRQEIITRFLMNQDVCPSSKKTYLLELKQYFAWIDNLG